MDRKLTLELRYATASIGSHAELPRAYRIAGGAAEWLEEISRWDCRHEAVKVLPLPTSATDRTPNAALLAAPTPIVATPRSVAYQCLANRLYIPLDGQLWPPVTEGELSELLQRRVYVWDPTWGLAAFEPEPWLSPSQLITHPGFQPTGWRPAPDTVVLAPRIFSMAAMLPPDADEAVQAGQEDIGQDVDKAGQLPRSDDESAPGAMGAASTKGKQIAANAAKMAASMLPGSWADRLGYWADQRQQEVDRTLTADQNREVERLMKMMEDNPDEGLKYAPPLANDIAHRGEAPAGGALGPRDTNFNLGRLSSSGPAQSWSVSNANYHRLRAQYREAANRELALRRFRRAAYIFAELLGEYRAAAGALMSGGHYRDAAALYTQKLNSKREAATCLEQGGLLSEAIELLIETEQFEKAGDLYTKLDQPEAAREQYLAAVKHLNTDSETTPLTIAKLQLNKLKDREGALATLSDAWPDGAGAKQSILMWFRLASDDLGHLRGDVLQQIERVADVGPEHALLAAEVLSERALERDELTDRNYQALQRVIASNLLEQNPALRPRMLRLLEAATPGDRLLRRDTRSYLQRIAKQSKSSSPRKLLSLVKRVRMPSGANWKSVCRVKSTLLVAGELSGALALLPIRWEMDQVNSMAVTIPWRGTQISPDTDILLASVPQGDTHVVVHPVGEMSLPVESIRTHTAEHWAYAGGLGGVSPATMDVHRDEGDFTWSLNYNTEQCVLDLYQGETPIKSRVVLEDTMLEPPEAFPRLSLAMSYAFVSWGHYLHSFSPSNLHEVHEILPQAIRRLAAAPTQAGLVALGFESGGMLVRCEDGAEQSFGDGVIEPEVCFQGRHLIVAGSKRLEAYVANGLDVQMVVGQDNSELEPTAVVAGPESGQFAVLSGSEMLFYQL